MLPAPTTDPVAERLAALELAVHRLTGVITAKLATPVELLTTAEAARRAKVCTKSIRTWVKLGILSDRRAGQGRGAALRLMADELDVLVTDGPDACRRYRERLGRA